MVFDRNFKFQSFGAGAGAGVSHLEDLNAAWSWSQSMDINFLETQILSFTFCQEPELDLEIFNTLLQLLKCIVTKECNVFYNVENIDFVQI